jgi:hypothetical protein
MTNTRIAIAIADSESNHTPNLNSSNITILAAFEYFHTSFHHTVMFFTKNGEIFRARSSKRKREIHGPEDLPTEAELIPASELLPPKLSTRLAQSADHIEGSSGLGMLS